MAKDKPHEVTPEPPPKSPSSMALTPQQYSDYLARKIYEMRFLESAKEYVDKHVFREKELETATRARDEALAAKAAALASIEAERTKAAQDAERQVAALRERLERDQAQAAARLGDAQARHKALLAELDRLTMLKTQAEEHLDAMNAVIARDIEIATARRDAVKAEEAAIRERLAAALGR
jgi:chromosome segregation ATPase